MKVKIPFAKDVAGLVDALDVSPTRATNLKNKIYYFLSLLTETNDNYRLNLNTGGYRNLCSKDLKKILGNKDFYTIREVLMNPEDPVVEVDGSWCSSTGSGFCQGYRIVPKYNTGEVVFKTLPHKLSRLILKEKSAHPNTPILQKYDYLLNQFDIHTISVDPRVYEYIYQFGTELLKRVVNNNPYQTKLIYNLIGRWIYYLNQIEEGNIWRKVSSKNHRLNSSITNLPKLLRPFVLCNGEHLHCVDVSSSQPYLLSSIMRSEFWTDRNEGYNVKTIYPELYSELIDSDMDTRTNYSINNGVEYYSTYTGSTYNIFSNYEYGSSSFMWCNFFNTTEMESIYQYSQSPFHIDFYLHLLHQYYTYTHTPHRSTLFRDRDKLKGSMMFVLFDDNKNHRYNNEQIQIFQTVYPGVNRWIEQIHDKIGKTRFSYLLQRVESYLLLDVICREFHEVYPAAPLITIHDGIFTTQEYTQRLNGFILKRLNELTGIVAGCKVKHPETDPIPTTTDIDSIWKEIETISTAAAFNRNTAGVFTSNIDRGMNFVENF